MIDARQDRRQRRRWGGKVRRSGGWLQVPWCASQTLDVCAMANEHLDENKDCTRKFRRWWRWSVGTHRLMHGTLDCLLGLAKDYDNDITIWAEVVGIT